MNDYAQSHEDAAQTLARKANEELIEKINQAHAEAELLAHETVDMIVRSINKARETGLYLNKLAEPYSRGKWGSRWGTLFRSKSNPNAPIHFNDVTASRWMRLANALENPLTKETLPEGVRHLTDMLRVVHALPDAQGHGEQQRHTDRSPFQSLTKWASELQGCISAWSKEKPVEEWNPDLKDQVKSQLEPVVKFYQSL